MNAQSILSHRFIAINFLLCVLLLTHHRGFAQSFNNSQLVTRIWTHTAGDPGDTLNWTNQVIDASRNLIVIGNTITSTNTTDMLLTILSRS